MSRFWFSKIDRDGFSRAARLQAGIDKIGGRTNQRAQLGQFCCAILWLTKRREPGSGSGDGDTICKSLESW